MPQLIKPPFALLAAAALAGLSITPLQAAEIRGTVTSEIDGKPVVDASVEVYKWYRRDMFWQFVHGDGVDYRTGEFQLQGLSAGRYYVRIYGDAQYRGEYYDSATDFADKQIIRLKADDSEVLNPIELGARDLYIKQMRAYPDQVPPEGGEVLLSARVTNSTNDAYSLVAWWNLQAWSDPYEHANAYAENTLRQRNVNLPVGSKRLRFRVTIPGALEAPPGRTYCFGLSLGHSPWEPLLNNGWCIYKYEIGPFTASATSPEDAAEPMAASGAPELRPARVSADGTVLMWREIDAP